MRFAVIVQNAECTKVMKMSLLQEGRNLNSTDMWFKGFLKSCYLHYTDGKLRHRKNKNLPVVK